VGVATLFWVVYFVKVEMFKRCYKRSKGFLNERFKKIVERFYDYCCGRV
jgi:hypothetical protein